MGELWHFLIFSSMGFTAKMIFSSTKESCLEMLFAGPQEMGIILIVFYPGEKRELFPGEVSSDFLSKNKILGGMNRVLNVKEK